MSSNDCKMTTELHTVLAAAIQVSPTQSVSKAFTDLVNKMMDDGCQNREILLAVAGSMYYGLVSGNWPAVVDIQH